MELDGTRASNKESFSIFEWDWGVISSMYQGVAGVSCCAMFVFWMESIQGYHTKG